MTRNQAIAIMLKAIEIETATVEATITSGRKATKQTALKALELGAFATLRALADAGAFDDGRNTADRLPALSARDLLPPYRRGRS